MKTAKRDYLGNLFPLEHIVFSALCDLYPDLWKTKSVFEGMADAEFIAEKIRNECVEPETNIFLG